MKIIVTHEAKTSIDEHTQLLDTIYHAHYEAKFVSRGMKHNRF